VQLCLPARLCRYGELESNSFNFGRIVLYQFLLSQFISAYISMSILCDEIFAKMTDDDVCEEIRCTAISVKAECAKCSLVNPDGNYDTDRKML